ncbi:large ribosomal subunit protein mL55 isoform 2-T4 [Morphnus guianensis]
MAGAGGSHLGLINDREGTCGGATPGWGQGAVPPQPPQGKLLVPRRLPQLLLPLPGTCVEDPSSLAWTKMAATSRALSALRLDAFPSLLPAFAASVRLNSNRAAVSHLRRQLYGRLYPILLVKTDGSTVRLRYKEPKRILMLPLDSSTLPEAERKARLRRQFPSRPKAGPEETFEGIDLSTYKRFWKK